MSEIETEHQSAMGADYDAWIKQRGPLGPGIVPERIFFAGWCAGNRRTPTVTNASAAAAAPGAGIRDDLKFRGHLRRFLETAGESERTALIAHIDAKIALAGQCGARQEPVMYVRQLDIDVMGHSPSARCLGYRMPEGEWIVPVYASPVGAQGEQPFDPMDWPLPCDAKVGAGTNKKGTPLRTLVARMKTLHRMATEGFGTKSAQPAHETIMREGDSLVCTACGTTSGAQPEADCHPTCGHIGAECDFPHCKQGDERAAALEEAAKLAIKFTAVPRDVLGPATMHMKTLAAVGEKLAAAIRALPAAPAQKTAPHHFACEQKGFNPLCAGCTAELAAAPAQAQPFPERDPSKPAEQQGIFRKFDVRRVDGSDQPGGKHCGCRYYVLDLTHDQHAPAAMRAYATSCRPTHPQLADDIEREFGAQAQDSGQNDEPDMLWLSDDNEVFANGPDEFANDYAAHCMLVGDDVTVDVDCANRASKRTMRIALVPKGEDDDAEVLWKWVDRTTQAASGSDVGGGI